MTVNEVLKCVCLFIKLLRNPFTWLARIISSLKKEGVYEKESALLSGFVEDQQPATSCLFITVQLRRGWYGTCDFNYS